MIFIMNVHRNRNIASVTLTWIRVGTYPNIHTSIHTFIHLDAHPEQLSCFMNRGWMGSPEFVIQSKK